MGPLLKKIFVVFTGRMAARGAQFLIFLLLARELSPADFGLYGLLITSVLLASLLGNLGLRQAVARQIGTGQTPQNRALGGLLSVLPVLALVSAVIVWFVIGADLTQPGTGLSNIGALLCVVLAVSGAMALVLFQGVLLGLGRTSGFALSDSLYPGLLMVTVGTLYLLTDALSILTVVACVTGAQLVSGVITFALASRGSAGIQPLKIPEIRHLIRTGIGYSVNLFLITLSVRVSLYFIQYMISQDAVGQFFAGQRLGDFLIEAATAVGLVLFSDGVRSTDPMETLRRNVTLSALVFWLFTLGGLLFSVLAGPITRLMLSDAYTDAGLVLAITAWMIAPASATKMIYPAIASMGRPLVCTPAVLVSIALNTLLCVLLIPAFGLVGAAWALVASQTALYIGYVITLKTVFQIPFRDCLLPMLKSKRISK